MKSYMSRIRTVNSVILGKDNFISLIEPIGWHFTKINHLDAFCLYCQGIWQGNIFVMIVKKFLKISFSVILTPSDLHSMHIILLNIYGKGIISFI